MDFSLDFLGILRSVVTTKELNGLLRSKSFKNRFQKSLKLMIDFSLDFREILRA